MALGRSKTRTTSINQLNVKADALRSTASEQTQAAQDFVAAAAQASNEAHRAASQAAAVDKAYGILADAGVDTL